jgi:MerR family transcriptional regulator, light-induced transcriptional regulator
MTQAGAYSAGAVARRLGVAVTTLRTWHQRYGMGPSLHEPGHHRRYTEQDVERLEAMQRLIVEGVAPSEAARWAGKLPPSGGNAPAVPAAAGLDTTSRGLSRAALRLDAPAVRQRVARAVRDLGVVAAWDDVLRPVLAAIGERHAATGGLIEVEHLLSGCISAVLGAVPRPEPGIPVHILLSCADEEQHSLPLEALAAALADAGVPTRMLGARVPPAALSAAVRRTGPSAVLVWSQLRSTGDPAQLSGVLTERARPVVVAAGGPGWDPSTLPAGVARPATLT